MLFISPAQHPRWPHISVKYIAISYFNSAHIEKLARCILSFPMDIRPVSLTALTVKPSIQSIAFAGKSWLTKVGIVLIQLCL